MARPSKMTPERVGKLETAFALGATDLEACFFAEIHKDTLYAYQKQKPEFTDRKTALKNQPVFKARKALLDALEDADAKIRIKAAITILERAEGRPRQSVDVTTPGHPTHEELLLQLA